ncbi:MAG: TolC family protein [Dysgonamonadaceae bacterium]|nr:TolC family protein [Dysgonamonadaceae bacterium]
MMKQKINCILLAALFIFPPVINAQEKVKSLQECIREAVENNLSIKSGKIAVKQAEDLQGTAFNIDPTTVSLSQDPTSGGSPDNSFSLSQSFDFPTVYFSRRSRLKAETGLERSRLEVTRNELVKQISSIYYQLLYAKENIRILQEQDSIYDHFAGTATARFKAGETNRLEPMNAERLCSENKMELQKAEKNYQNIQLNLQRWMNSDEWITPAESTLPVIEPLDGSNDFNPEQTPLNRVFESKKTAGEKNLNLTRQGFLPTFNIALRSQYLIPGFNPYHITRNRFDKGNCMGFEIGISLPLFFGEQRAKVRAAKREIAIITLRQEETLNSLNKEYQIVMNDYRKAKNVLDYYRTQGKEQAHEINRISQLAYQKGEIDYPEYILNLKTAIDLHLQYANAVNDYNQTVITLNYLQGNQ